MEMLAVPPDDSSSADPSSVKSEDSSPRPEGGRTSPPPNCAICLGTCRNKSFTDSCLHQFCFKCLLTWSKVKAECPLCKQNFRSIIHNVQSNHQYEEYLVEQRVEEVTERVDLDSVTTATQRFRYRTTLTFPRGDTGVIQDLLRHYPLVAEALPPPSAAMAALTSSASRRRRSPVTFRRTVYRHNLWARPLPDFTGRFRDCRPEFYRYNDTQTHRLVPWLNRELHYLLNENIGHISYVLTRILELLPQYHIHSPEFREAMVRYFGDRTAHFLHELYCFASTPYDMAGYDRNVQYTTDSRISSTVNEISSTDSDASIDSDIVMVSSSHPTAVAAPPQPAAGPSTAPTYPQYPNAYIPQLQNNVIPIETISHSDTEDDDDVMVVGYIKPPQDRTPEVVDLVNSDSDVVVQDNEPPAAPPSDQGLVRLSLRRGAARRRSDSSESYRPPARRRRRLSRRSRGSASTRDTRRTTPSPRLTTPSPRLITPSPRHTTPSMRLTPSPPCTPPPPSTPSPSVCVTPSPSSTEWTSTFSDTYSSSDSDSDTFSSSGSYRRGVRKRKAKTKLRNPKSKKRCSSRSRRRRRRLSPESEPRPGTSTNTDRRNKKKSNSGKGVKSSREMCGASQTVCIKSDNEHTPPVSDHEGTPPLSDVSTPPMTPPLSDVSTPPMTPPSFANQPGPSGLSMQLRDRSPTSIQRRSSRDSRRLRSVVNVMYNSMNSRMSDDWSCNSNGLSSFLMNTSNDDSNSQGYTSNLDSSYSMNMSRPRAVEVGDSDSEDDLPLNLTIRKSYTSL